MLEKSNSLTRIVLLTVSMFAHAYAAPIKLCPSSLGCESVNDGAKRQFLTVTLLSIIDLSVAVA